MPLKPPPNQQRLNEGGIPSPTWLQWFSNVTRFLKGVNQDLSYAPPSLADSEAGNNSIYYSTTQSKLVYKDNVGVVNDLY